MPSISVAVDAETPDVIPMPIRGEWLPVREAA
jgi:hypothetical protein